MTLPEGLNSLFVKKVTINRVRHIRNTEIPISSDTKKHLIITGKNGSGKTSLLEAISSYIQMVYYKDVDIKQYETNIKIWKEEINRLNTLVEATTKEESLLNLSKQISRIKENLNSHQEMLNQCNAATLELNNEYLIHDAIASGEYLIDFEQFMRLNKQNQVEGTKYIDFKKSYRPNESLSQTFSQFLTNQRNDMLNYKEENNHSNYERVKKWLEEIVTLFREILDDNTLEFKYNMKKRVYEIIQVDREPFSLNEMSSGYAAYLKIVSEILLRMHIVEHGNYNINGLCLIDEIDAHLHVDLQSKALPLLTKFFPGIQFIVTTHSPFVINSISNSVVFDLENKLLIDDPSKYSIDAINKTYFHADSYSKELKEKLNRYDELSSQSEIDDSERKEVDDLMEYFNNTPTHFSPELKSRILDIQLKGLLNDKHKKTS